MTGEKDFSDIDVERPEIMTPAEFIRKERSRYVENVPCVCFFRCQHTIKQASAKLSYVVVYPTSQVYTSRVLFSFTVRDYKKRFESSVGLQVCEYQAFDGGIFFFGNRKLRTVCPIYNPWKNAMTLGQRAHNMHPYGLYGENACFNMF